MAWRAGRGQVEGVQHKLLPSPEELTLLFPQTPHLVNLNEDPLMSECLLYYIKDGITRWE